MKVQGLVTIKIEDMISHIEKQLPKTKVEFNIRLHVLITEELTSITKIEIAFCSLTKEGEVDGINLDLDKVIDRDRKGFGDKLAAALNIKKNDTTAAVRLIKETLLTKLYEDLLESKTIKQISTNFV